MAYIVYLYDGKKFYGKKRHEKATINHKDLGRSAHIIRNICHSTPEL